MPPVTCSNTAPSYASSLINSYALVPALCSTQACLMLLFLPCMLAEVSSSLFPSAWGREALSWKTSCVSPCLLYISVYLNFDSPKGILQLFLHVSTEPFQGQRGIEFIHSILLDHPNSNLIHPTPWRVI